MSQSQKPADEMSNKELLEDIAEWDQDEYPIAAFAQAALEEHYET